MRNRIKKRDPVRPKMTVTIIGFVLNNHERAVIKPERNAKGCAANIKRRDAINPHLITFVHFEKPPGVA